MCEENANKLRKSVLCLTHYLRDLDQVVMIIRFIIDGTKIETIKPTKPFCNVGNFFFFFL